MTRRSPEPGTSICLPHSPLLILPPYALTKDTDCPPHTLDLSPKFCKATGPASNLGRSQMPSSGTRLNHKLGRWRDWWLVPCLVSWSTGRKPRPPAEPDTLPGWHERSLRLHHCLPQPPKSWHCCRLIKAGTARCSGAKFIIGTDYCLFDCGSPAMGLQGFYALTMPTGLSEFPGFFLRVTV